MSSNDLELQKQMDIAVLGTLPILKGKTEEEIRELYRSYSHCTRSAGWLHLGSTKNFEAWLLRMKKLFT